MGKPDKRYAGSWKLRGHGDIEALTDDAEKVRHEIESLSDKAVWVGLTAKDRVRIAELSKMDSTPKAEHILTAGIHIDEILTPPISIRGLGGIRLA